MSATGTWNMSIKTPMGEQKSVLTLVQDGGSLTGTNQDVGGEPLPIKDGAVQGANLSWKFDVKRPFPMTVEFNLALDGDRLSGKAKAGMFPPAPVSATRAG
jgi:hypothetical protein